MRLPSGRRAISRRLRPASVRRARRSPPKWSRRLRRPSWSRSARRRDRRLGGRSCEAYSRGSRFYDCGTRITTARSAINHLKRRRWRSSRAHNGARQTETLTTRWADPFVTRGMPRSRTSRRARANVPRRGAGCLGRALLHSALHPEHLLIGTQYIPTEDAGTVHSNLVHDTRPSRLSTSGSTSQIAGINDVRISGMCRAVCDCG